MDNQGSVTNNVLIIIFILKIKISRIQSLNCWIKDRSFSGALCLKFFKDTSKRDIQYPKEKEKTKHN